MMARHVELVALRQPLSEADVGKEAGLATRTAIAVATREHEVPNAVKIDRVQLISEAMSAKASMPSFSDALTSSISSISVWTLLSSAWQ